MTRRPEFIRCYDTGRRYYTRNFVLFLLASGEEQPWRLGLAVTRKTGPATVRNRVKRMLREFFRLHQDLLPEADMVVVPKRHMNPAFLTQTRLADEFLPVFQGLGQVA